MEMIKKDTALKFAEDIIAKMDIKEVVNDYDNTIDYRFSVRALDDKKSRDFEDKINELERNLNMCQFNNNSLKISNEELVKDNKIMKDKIDIIENGNFWSRLKFIFGVN